jgi:hypothetical protein
MAKLNTLVKQAMRREADQMGFGTAPRKQERTMLLIAIAGDHWSRATAEAADADAVLLLGKPGERDVTDAVAAAGERPVGVALNDSSLDSLPRLRQAKVDYILVGTNAPAATLAEEELALVLHLREDLTDMQLRAVASSTVDAIYVERDAASTTILKLLDLQRVAGLASKPLIVQCSSDTSKEDLTALRDNGVLMLAVDMKERNAAETLKKLRESIAGLPRRASRKKDAREPLLPASSAPAHGHDHDEDDD